MTIRNHLFPVVALITLALTPSTPPNPEAAGHKVRKWFPQRWRRTVT